jgi:hypothetical protein
MTEAASSQSFPALHSLRASFRDSVIVLVCCAVVGISTNALRDNGIPLVQNAEYEIFAPCPETTGEVATFRADDPRLRDSRVLLIDARSLAEYELRHAPQAVNIPFDYLDPTDSATIHTIASSGVALVVVYGDGKNPDSGEQLARELAGKGIRNVGFISGGANAIFGASGVGQAP